MVYKLKTDSETTNLKGICDDTQDDYGGRDLVPPGLPGVG
jgi:hypothetical protein